MKKAEEKLKKLLGKRTLLVGIGQPLRGDDGAGVELARRLAAKGKKSVIEAGNSPENFLGPVTSARPEVVLIADAARLGRSPGGWDLLNRGEISDGTASTHDSSLGLLMEFWEKETGGRVLLLGIEGKDTRWGRGLSPEVARSLSLLEETLLEILE